MLVMTALGCGDPEFTTAASAPDGTGGTSIGSANFLASAGSNGGDSVAVDSPCGPLRNDPLIFSVELCIPANSFVMGSATANLGTGHADHTPPHQVTLSAFVIDAFEVTIGRYRACVAAGRCETPSSDATRGCTYDTSAGPSDHLPVSCVTAAHAGLFCAWDGNRRLPTEAEWERSARGTNERAYPWGTTFVCDRAVAAANGACASLYKSPQAVGSLPMGDSADGAHDMAGNVAEWVKDFASSYPNGTVTDPVGPEVGVTRILRGGSYTSNSPDAQSFVRMAASETTIGANGFRCSRSVTK